MKKTFKTLSLLVGLGIAMISCNKSELSGYSKTDNGLYYKFEVENKTAPQPKVGDVLEVEFEIKFKDSVLHSTMGHPEMIECTPMFKGDLNEGLLLMHVGDKISIAVSADSLSKFIPIPDNFEKDKGEKIFFNINLKSIISKDEIEKERIERITAAAKAETDSIVAYVTRNNVKVTPTESGLYITFVKKGTGIKVEKGKKVKANYTGRFLDGRVFDTSLEPVAKEAGIHNPNRPYGPVDFPVQEGATVSGFYETLLQTRVGDIVEVIIPSRMGYGDRGNQVIPPYTPLFFRIEIVGVE